MSEPETLPRRLAALYDHRTPHRYHHAHAHTHDTAEDRKRGRVVTHAHRHGHYGTYHAHPFAHDHGHRAPGHTPLDGRDDHNDAERATMDGADGAGADLEARARRIWAAAAPPVAAASGEEAPTYGPCPSCGTATVDEWLGCAGCRAKLPPALIKATTDDFEYACRLRTGEVLRFSSARVHGAYATLHGDATRPGHTGPAFAEAELPYGCPRGVDVRIADIVWCADAPDGS